MGSNARCSPDWLLLMSTLLLWTTKMFFNDGNRYTEIWKILEFPMLSSDKWLHVNKTMIKSMCWQGLHYPPEITTLTREQTQYDHGKCYLVNLQICVLVVRRTNWTLRLRHLLLFVENKIILPRFLLTNKMC